MDTDRMTLALKRAIYYGKDEQIQKHGRSYVKVIRKFWDTYSHGAWIAAYMAFYMLGFFILEHAGHRHYHVIHSVVDDLIPFNEYFIIPYDLWFLYMVIGICWFIFFCRSKTEYYKLVCVLSIGMTIFLIVSCVYPNCQDLRPQEFARQNMFTDMVAALYKTDTPTNILPSIHVYNSLALFYGLNSSSQLRQHRAVRAGALILTVLIVLSTMFLKQHSVVDVSMGILTSLAVQMFCDRVFAPETSTVYSK